MVILLLSYSKEVDMDGYYSIFIFLRGRHGCLSLSFLILTRSPWMLYFSFLIFERPPWMAMILFYYS